MNEREHMARALGWKQETMFYGQPGGHYDFIWRTPAGDVYDELPPFEDCRQAGDTFDQWRDRCRRIADAIQAAAPYTIGRPQ